MRPSSPRTVDWIVGRTAVACGFVGLFVGLIVGLNTYVPTAWAAALEIGLPAALAGVLVGLAIAGVRGLVRAGCARRRQTSARTTRGIELPEPDARSSPRVVPGLAFVPSEITKGFRDGQPVARRIMACGAPSSAASANGAAGRGFGRLVNFCALLGALNRWGGGEG